MLTDPVAHPDGPDPLGEGRTRDDICGVIEIGGTQPCPEAPIAMGWCRRHHSRWYGHGYPQGAKAKKRYGPRNCTEDGCEEPWFRRGQCETHYRVKQVRTTQPSSRSHQPALGGLFSGIGGFELAWQQRGGRIAWMCEIDPDARDMLRIRFPGVPIYEDVRDLDPAAVEPVDVLTGGSPCTTFSMAGLRTGMQGESGLVTEMLRIIDGLAARGLSDVIWENVPGVLSATNPDGTAVWPQLVAGFLLGSDADSVDVKELTEEFDPATNWSAGMATGPHRALAWRTLDSRYVGAQVPQRRRRVFAHVALGPEREDRALAGLLEGDGGERDTEGNWVPPWGQQLGIFGAAGSRLWLLPDDRDGHVKRSLGTCLPTRSATADPCTGGHTKHAHRSFSSLIETDASGHLMLTPRWRLGALMRSARRDGTMPPHLRGALEAGIVDALGRERFDEIIAMAAAGKSTNDLTRDDRERLDALGRWEETLGAQPASEHGTLYRMTEFGSYVAAEEASTLLARDSRGCKDFVVDAVDYPPRPRARFVSLIESERLQGFPDNWTKPLGPDGPRRKALGNAVTVTAVRWVLDRAVPPRQDGGR
ncbi:DNA-cytosine methyltransferase (plasmid) [Euzebya pacifica]|uniref:DNA (cytosine-5-)-methyltransferase n=2 Tax=Euzebya pacifica TaxID=1608957 RepID=A0A346Y708_9ACTN|nr:DNA-cytosine methyltransferase [Euzebya pacifica]